MSAAMVLSTLAGDPRLYWNFQCHADFRASYCAAVT
jgi:hypothetical protein